MGRPDHQVTIVPGPDLSLAVVQLGHRHSQHVFYKVLKTNLSARFVQQDDGRRAMRIAVVKLTLVSKDGDKGVFQSNFEHQQLDLWELLQHVGMVLPNLFIKGFQFDLSFNLIKQPTHCNSAVYYCF